MIVTKEKIYRLLYILCMCIIAVFGDYGEKLFACIMLLYYFLIKLLQGGKND